MVKPSACPTVRNVDDRFSRPGVERRRFERHTLGRDVLMITQAEGDVPFDLRHLRFVQYVNNAEGRMALADALRRRLNALE
jgi:hypothetical protein